MRARKWCLATVVALVGACGSPNSGGGAKDVSPGSVPGTPGKAVTLNIIETGGKG